VKFITYNTEREDHSERHAARVSRYLVAPALSLADLGAYALLLAGLGRATPALTALGLVEGDVVCSPPPATALLSQLAWRSGIELSEHGQRKIGVAPTTRQDVIGRPIGDVIGDLIGSAPERELPFSPSGRGEQSRRAPRPITPGILRNSSDSLTPLPTPLAPGGGGRPAPRQHRTGPPKPHATPIPQTDATRLLRTIDVRPAQQIELAGMPITAVETAIADGRSRQGIRDLAGWVVYLLRQRRDHGWTPPPPAPRADAPEALGAYFAQLAAKQAAGQGAMQCHEHPPAECPPEVVPTSTPPAPPPKAEQPPSLAELWEDVLATLRLRLPREVYQACVRQATLMGYAEGVVTIGVADLHTKDKLQFGYLGVLRLALGYVLGRDVTVRLITRRSLPALSHDHDA
jgi:hypothetical protein